MTVIVLEVPSVAQMGYGLGKAMQYGVEYEVLDQKTVELTCTNDMKLATMMVAFRGKLISSSLSKNVQVELPRHEA